jgi:hypothetical protein
MLPPDDSFLDGLTPTDVDGSPNLLEKDMLLVAARFFFGPGQWWNAIKDVSEPNSLNELDKILRKPGERYEKLEQQTDLPEGYFNKNHVATNQVKLHVASKRDEHTRVPQYFLYEPRFNLSLYVGPDILHGKPVPVINALVLDDQHRPTESYTFIVKCES